MCHPIQSPVQTCFSIRLNSKLSTGNTEESTIPKENDGDNEGLKVEMQQLTEKYSELEDKYKRALAESENMLRISPKVGENFDPNLHEAVFQAPVEAGKEKNTVAVVTKVGYTLHGRTLRPAFVGVFGP
ncbi:unnamed protein product [Trichobilharzia regenti]|nr:unnamed protein product [Trichobilharzia regenti]